MRRTRVVGDITLGTGFSSGGFLANSEVTGTLYAGSQQQFFFRNDSMGNFWENLSKEHGTLYSWDAMVGFQPLIVEQAAETLQLQLVKHQSWQRSPISRSMPAESILSTDLNTRQTLRATISAVTTMIRLISLKST